MENVKHKLSVIVPCYNEKRTIERILEAVKNTSIPDVDKEIIIIDDHSTDGTQDILRRLKGDEYNQLHIIYNKKNAGKTACLVSGIKACSGTLVIIQDADLEYDPQDYHRLIRPFVFEKADVVYGSRFKGELPQRFAYQTNRLGNRLATALANLVNGLGISDLHTCYIMLRGDLARELAPKLTSKDFGFNPEINARLAKIRDLRLFEVGISYNGRTKAEGKHIKLRDGVRGVLEIFYYNFLKKD